MAGLRQNESKRRSDARAAEALVRAETERNERLKLEAQFAWRRIDDAQKVEMISVLSKTPQSVFVIWISGDPEATLLAWQLLDIFQKAGWRAGGEGRSYPNSIVTNVILSGPNAALISPTLESAGLKSSIDPIPPLTGMVVPHNTGVTEANASAVMLVGSRLRPVDEAVLDSAKAQLGKKKQ
jgi:hypothetical protein